MTVLNIYEVRALPEPQRDYNFDVYFPSANGVAAPPCEAVDMPFYAMNGDSYLINYRRHNTAGQFTLNNFSATFYEDLYNSAELWYEAWLGMIRNADGTFNYPSYYKQDVLIFKLDVMDIVVDTVRYVGCFPVVAEPYRFKSALSGRIVLQVSFLADEVYKA